MKCPYCGSDDTRVLDTRDTRDAIRRRRECRECGQRFTTYERAVLGPPQVVKRDGRREEWDFQKLLNGIRTACAKRPIAWEDIERLAQQVEAELIELGRPGVSSVDVGARVLEKLQDLDEVAYIRFASVYLPLADLEALRREVNRLLERRHSDRLGAAGALSGQNRVVPGHQETTEFPAGVLAALVSEHESGG